MAEIKQREKVKGTIKTLDKGKIATEKAKSSLVGIKERGENSYDNTNENNANEYAVNRLNAGGKYAVYNSNKIKTKGNNAVRDTKDNFIKTKNKVKTIKSKLTEKKKIKEVKNKIKTSKNIVKDTPKVAKQTIKTTERAKQLAIKTAKTTYNGVKAVFKATVSAVKGIIAGTKALISLLLAGGWIAIIIVVIICLIGLICTSWMGIFFSSESTRTTTMSSVIKEINKEMADKIVEIQNNNPHDDYKIESNQAEWKDVLAIYTVKITKGNNIADVITMDNKKKQELKKIFWDMNSLNYEIKTEKHEQDTIGTLIDNNLKLSENSDFTTLPSNSNTEETTILYIYINSKSIDYMKNKYNFSSEQEKQLEEITSDEFNNLWSAVIYGTYEYNDELADWKQTNKDWSDIKLGTTNSTIGDIGCLVTSIAVLIKKSNVPTNDIYPFNPSTFVIALNNSYGFDEKGNLQYSAISKVVPKFVYQGTVNLNGKTRTEKLYELTKYLEMGYYISAEVYGTTQNNQHWVAIDNISNNTIIMYDPASSATNMWDKYNWSKTSQFIYFSKK